MKKVMVLLAAFMLLGSVGAFAESGTLTKEASLESVASEAISKVLLPASWQQTSSCGVTYTITVLFCPCSGFELYLVRQQAQIDIDAQCPQGPPIPY